MRYIIKKIGLSLFLLLIFILVFVSVYNFAEPKAYDFMTKNILVNRLPFDNTKQIYGSDDVVLVIIDLKSVERYRWPWKREMYCKIFEYLDKYAHPKAIVFDSILATEDIDNPESDKKLFRCIKNIKNLIVGFLPNMVQWENPSDGEKYSTKFAKKFSLKVDNQTSYDSVIYYSLVKFPDNYFNAVKHVGSVSMFPGIINGDLIWGHDEVYRTHEYLFMYNNNFYPSMAMNCFLMINNYPKIVLNDDYIIFPELNYKIKQTKTLYQTISPVRYFKLYPSGYSHIKYSAIDIMDSYDRLLKGKTPVISPKLFKDKIVVVGANVPAGTSLNDIKNTPIINNQSGADYQACAIDNIVHNDFLHVMPQSVNVLITIICMILLFWLIKIGDLAKSVLSLFLVILGYLIFGTVCFYFKIIVNIITPIVMFILTTIMAYTYKFVIERQGKEKVKTAMGKYMSADVMQNVVKNIDNLGLGGKKAVVSVLFADIRGFTSLSEKMSAQQVSELLNEYFTMMEPIITEHKGIINKFIGDAIMAIFGEPIQNEEHAENSVKCAYQMLLKVQELNKKWEREGRPTIEIGIGINTGEVFVGNIGSINRMEYTVIGDTVNLASRLESYNKTYRTKLLISKSTYEKVKTFATVIKIPEVQIRGKANKIDIYEVLKVEENINKNKK